MLIRFSIENFLSFKNRETFSMIAGRGGRDKTFHIIKKNSRNDIDLLKTAVIFGANASGKSNLIKAIDFGKKQILKGTPVEQLIEFQNFRLHKDCIKSPSRIEYEIKHKGASYAYGFVFDETKIIEEWLYKINKSKEEKIFERSNTSDFDLSFLKRKNDEKSFQFIDFIAKGTPDNQLFLTEIRNRKVKDNVNEVNDLLNVIDWFQNALTIFYPKSKFEGVEFELNQNTELATVFEEFLKYFDTGINGISLKKVDFDKTDIPSKLKDQIKSDLLNNKSEKTGAWVEDPIENVRYIFSKTDSGTIEARKLMTKHCINGEINSFDFFDVKEESDGTQRIMDFIPLLIDLLKGDNVFIVDEMERSLHANLIYEIIDLFLSKSTGINSQLILASHETTLLTQKLFRKDEIWFTIKNEIGASKIYSLEDYNIRFDKQIRKDYLVGRYKAVPRFGNRHKLSILNNA